MFWINSLTISTVLSKISIVLGSGVYYVLSHHQNNTNFIRYQGDGAFKIPRKWGGRYETFHYVIPEHTLVISLCSVEIIVIILFMVGGRRSFRIINEFCELMIVLSGITIFVQFVTRNWLIFLNFGH